MKHIFTVHSNITYLSALGVITLRNLDAADCLIFSLSFSIPQNGVRTHTLASNSSRLYRLLHLKRYFNTAKIIYRVADDFIGDDTFEVYAPCMVREATLFYAHPKCVKLNFIEEGLSAYCEGFSLCSLSGYSSLHKFTLSFWARLREVFEIGKLIMHGYTAKVQAMPVYYTSYIGNPNVDFYGFSSLSFPSSPSNKHVISFTQISQRFTFRSTMDINNSHIWIGEYLDPSEDFNFHISGIEQGLVQRIKAEGIKSIFIKFHPSQKENLRIATMSLLDKYSINYKIIPDNVIMELEFIEAKNLHIYGCSSSLLVYGAMMGHHAVSINKHIRNYPDIEVPIFNEVVKQ